MWVLVLTNPAGKTRQIPFEGDQLVLGRSRSADVTVEDPRMSRMHLRFARGPKGSLTVEDLGAANGVYVQSQRIGAAPQAVSVGDQIQFGDCRVVVAAPVSAYAPGLSQASLPSVAASAGSGALVPWVLFTPSDGRSHVIAGPTVVGRSLGADISLDHPSVSRRHAMLAPLPNGQLRVEDAGGTNGTFVDGERVDSEHMIKVETSIVFGEFVGVLKPQQPMRRLPIRLPKMNRDLAQKVMVGLLAVLGLLLLIKGPNAPKRVAWEDRRARVESSLSEARSLQTSGAWQEAVPVVGTALAADPLNQEARQLKLQLEREIKAQREFIEGIAAFDEQDYDSALNSFSTIPVGTKHYPESQEKRATAQDSLLNQYRERAERACRSSRWKTCQSEACTYLAYDHSETLVRLLASAESKLARRAGFQRCNTLKARSEDDPKVRKRKEALTRIYPDARLRQAMEHYASGRLGQASRELSNVLVDSRRKSLQGQASSLRHDVQRVEGYLKRIREIERSGDLMMALRQWGLIRKVDKELLQGQVDSKVLIDTRAMLTGFLIQRSGQRLDQKRFKESLSDLTTAWRVDPQNVGVSSAVKKLAAEAPDEVAKMAISLLERKPATARENNPGPSSPSP